MTPVSNPIPRPKAALDRRFTMMMPASMIDRLIEFTKKHEFDSVSDAARFLLEEGLNAKR